MSIWFKSYDLQAVKPMAEKYLVGYLGIELTALGDNYLKGTMPVDERTWMPLGILHGGASCVLAESLASFATFLTIDPASQRMVGLEINANHLRQVKQGYVTGTARPIHIGRSTQVWDIQIQDEEEKLVCISRMTMAILGL